MSALNATSNPEKQALAKLRADIDRVDQTLHELLRERTEIVDKIHTIKSKTSICIRPGRDAQILKNLLNLPQGKLLEGIVVRLWREIISHTYMQIGGVKVAVYAPAKGPDLWDYSRDHFGALVPLQEYKDALLALKAVQAGKANVAVLPFPDEKDKTPWWTLLTEAHQSNLAIFGAIPFEILKAGRNNARNTLPQGLLVGPLYPELTGDDRSFLALTCAHVPEAEMRRLLGKAGYKVRQFFFRTSGRGTSAPTTFFVEVDGFVGKADTRLSRIKAMLGSRLQHLLPLGGYAVPVKSGRR